MRSVLGIATIFKWVRLTGASLMLGVVLSGCTNMLFYPQPGWVRTPAQLGVEYRDVEIASSDGTKLSAWWLDTPTDAKGTILYLHGNAENISTHLGNVYWLPEAGYQVLLLDYRGYGHSEGNPGLPEIFDDIAVSLEWLLEQSETADMPVYVLGQSLGASMGGYVAATYPDLRAGLTGIVLDAGFTGYAEVGREVASRHWLTWAFQYPVAWGMPNNYDLIDYIHDIAPTPLLIIHGTEDEVIPFSFGERLYSAAGDPKAFLRYDGPHTGTFRDLGNRDLVLGFLERAARQPADATNWVDGE
jgi:fermentation-respiration switch protein FrsA (DUF1100 family)